MLNLKGWNSHAHRDFPDIVSQRILAACEKTHPGRDTCPLPWNTKALDFEASDFETTEACRGRGSAHAHAGVLDDRCRDRASLSDEFRESVVHLKG